MDLLHSGRFDGFCLVSSDSDFTRLAARIREQGVDVFGFGEQKTPESFRQALSKVRVHGEPASRCCEQSRCRLYFKPLLAPQRGTPIIMKVITQMEKRRRVGGLWGKLENKLANLASDFDPRTFGFRKLGDLVRRTNSFEIDHPKGAPCAFARSPLESPSTSKSVTKAAT